MRELLWRTENRCWIFNMLDLPVLYVRFIASQSQVIERIEDLAFCSSSKPAQRHF